MEIANSIFKNCKKPVTKLQAKSAFQTFQHFLWEAFVVVIAAFIYWRCRDAIIGPCGFPREAAENRRFIESKMHFHLNCKIQEFNLISIWIDAIVELNCDARGIICLWNVKWKLDYTFRMKTVPAKLKIFSFNNFRSVVEPNRNSFQVGFIATS